jgi:hypothetical protein
MILKGDDNLVVSTPLHWRRSTKCASETCVEVAISGNRAYVRSSQAAGTYLVFDAEEWRSFLSGVEDREFDIR